MTRREALGVVVVALLVALGRLVRRRLILGPDGAWRDPGWLEEHLPPLPEAADPADRAPQCLAGPLDPNQAPVDSLLLLPGIGPALAERIVDARSRGVHFACARDLQVIRGIGPKLAERIAPQLVFPTPDSVSFEVRQTAR